MAAIIVSSYKKLFSSSSPNFPNDLNNLLHLVCTDIANDMLCVVPSKEEVCNFFYELVQGARTGWLFPHFFSKHTSGTLLARMLHTVYGLSSEKDTCLRSFINPS